MPALRNSWMTTNKNTMKFMVSTSEWPKHRKSLAWSQKNKSRPRFSVKGPWNSSLTMPFINSIVFSKKDKLKGKSLLKENNKTPQGSKFFKLSLWRWKSKWKIKMKSLTTTFVRARFTISEIQLPTQRHQWEVDCLEVEIAVCLIFQKANLLCQRSRRKILNNRNF